MFPVTKLTPASPNLIPGQRRADPPTPTLVDGEEEYEVEKILNSRFHYRHLEYLVQWKGYDAGQNMWVPTHNVFAPDAVAAFNQQNSGAP